MVARRKHYSILINSWLHMAKADVQLYAYCALITDVLGNITDTNVVERYKPGSMCTCIFGHQLTEAPPPLLLYLRKNWGRETSRHHSPQRHNPDPAWCSSSRLGLKSSEIESKHCHKFLLIIIYIFQTYIVYTVYGWRIHPITTVSHLHNQALLYIHLNFQIY